MIVTLMLAALAAQPAGPVLTLDEALAAADAKNLDLVASRARLSQAKEMSRKAWAGYLPQVSLSGQYTYNSASATFPMVTGTAIRDLGVPTSDDPSLPGSATTLAEVPTGFSEIDIQKTHQLNGTAQLQQGLIMPSLWSAIASAGLAIENTNLNVENLRQEILLATAQLYYSAVTLKESVGVQRRLLEVNEAHAKDALAKFEAGTATKIVLLRAQIDEATARQGLRRSELGYASALSSLATMLDREPDFDVVRPAEPEDVSAEKDLDEKALEQRLDLKAARVSVQLSEEARRGKYLNYLPSLAFIARWNISNAAGFTGEFSTWTAGLGLNWTLWDGGLREAEVREASAKIEESQATLRATENKVRDEVRRGLLDLETARSNRQTADEQLALARENAELVRASFEAGVATYLEVTDANGALTNAELAHLRESLNVDLAVLKVARAAGLFEPLK